MMGLFSQWSTTTQHNPDTTPNNISQLGNKQKKLREVKNNFGFHVKWSYLGKNKFIHDRCVISTSDPISSITNTKIDKFSTKGSRFLYIGIDAFVDFIQDDWHSCHNRGFQNTGISFGTRHNHCTCIG